MSEPLLGALLIALMFLLFALGVEISIALGVVGVVGLLYLKGFNVGLGVVGSIAWSNATSFSFIAVPLFVFMSGILLHSGIGSGLYTAVARWVSFLPGGLAVASIFSCAIFAAISGLERGHGRHHRHDRHPRDGAARLLPARSSSARSPPAARSASSSRPRSR